MKHLKYSCAGIFTLILFVGSTVAADNSTDYDDLVDKFRSQIFQKKNLKPEMQDYVKSSTEKYRMFLKNWINYADNDVVKASNLYLKSLEWRKANGIDQVLNRTTKPGFDIAEFPYRLTGFDDKGAPVAFIPFGSWDGRHAIQQGYRNELIYRMIGMTELMIEEGLKNNSTSPQAVILVDLKGFSLYQVTSIRAPSFFPPVFQLVKSTLSTKVLDAFDVFGSDEKEWKAAIRKAIPLSAYPHELL